MSETITVLSMALDLLVIMGCSIGIVRAIPREKETQRWIRITSWIIYGALACVLPLLKSDIITIIVLTTVYVGIGRLFYYKNKMGILYQVIFWMVLMTTQYMAAYLMFAIVSILQLDSPIPGILLVLIRAGLLLSVTFVMRTIILKRYVPGKKYLKIRGMILVPIFSMVLMFLYTVSSEMFLIRYGYGWLFLFGGLLIVINVYCLYFWYDVAKNRELKHRLELMQQQNALTLQYYEDLENNYSNSRKIIHDIRNHLSVLEQAGKMEESSYIKDLHEMLNSLGMKFYTESKMLNIVLNDKLKEFPEGQAECRLGGVSLDFISDMDMTTIFANLLDNAIEAQPDLEKRSVRILGEQIQDFTVIKLTNPVENEDRRDSVDGGSGAGRAESVGGSGRSGAAGTTVKKNHEGLGLLNVKSAVEKYHGELRISEENKEFSVTLVFPNMIEEQEE